MNYLHIAAASIMCALSANAGFIVTPTDSPTTLANTILGSGITLIGTPTLKSQSGQSGTFTNFDSGPYTQTGGAHGDFTMASGIILTSGLAASAQVPYPSNGQSAGADSDVDGAGDADLSALIGGQATFDADVLDIKFTSTSSKIFFNFAFASTEYPEFIGSFDDVFGLLVNGINVGVIPGTTTPISVNTVNAATNSQFFTQYSSLSAGTPFDYGGITTLLTASATVVGDGVTVNEIRLGVADALDHALDSAILIQGGTLGTTSPTVPEPSGVAMIAAGLLAMGGVTRLRRRSNRRA